MPATTASALWNTGRRAWMFLFLVSLPLASQSLPRTSTKDSKGVSRLSLEPVVMIPNESHQPSDPSEQRLIWRSNLDGIQKISVSSPRVPGLWLRVTIDDEGLTRWRFITLQDGWPVDFIFGHTRTWGTCRLTYDFHGSPGSRRHLPVVFTLTEG